MSAATARSATGTARPSCVKINDDGRVVMHSGECDMGQGAMTMLSQIVAHELDMPLAHVHVLAPDTDTSPYAHRLAGLARDHGRRQCRDRAPRAGARQAVRPGRDAAGSAADELELATARCACIAAPTADSRLAELARLHIWRHGGEGIQVSGTWDAQTQMPDDQIYGNIAPALFVRRPGGRSRGRHRDRPGHACSTATSPTTAARPSTRSRSTARPTAPRCRPSAGRCTSSCSSKTGGSMNGNFADYTMATADAVPMLRGGIVESNDPTVPTAPRAPARPLSCPAPRRSPTRCTTPSACASRELPITPEKVLAALRALSSRRHSHA